MRHYLHWNSWADLPSEIRGRLWLGNDEVLAFRDGDLLALAWRAAKNQQHVIMCLLNTLPGQLLFQHVSLTLSHRQSRLLYILTTSRWMEWTQLTSMLSTTSYARQWRGGESLFFFWTIKTAVVNSYVLYDCTLTPRSPNHLAYRHEIVENLATRSLASAPPRRQIGCPCKCQLTEQSEPQWLNQQHNLSDRATQLHNCVVCSDRATKRCRTIYFCIDTPALCAHPCMFRTIPHPYKL